MKLDEEKIVNVDHTLNIPFPKQLAEFLKVDYDGNRLFGNSEYGVVDYTFYTQFEGLKIIIHDCEVKKELGVRHLPREDSDFIYVMMLREGDITHIYESDENIQLFGPGRKRGIIISNLKRPIINYGMDKMNSQWVTFLIKKSLLFSLLEDQYSDLKALFDNEDPWVFFEPFNYSIITALDKMFSIPSTAVSKKSVIYGQTMSILGDIFELFAHRRVEDVKMLSLLDTERMFAVKSFITKDLSITPSLEEICKEFGISRSKLIRDFKAEFGKPVYQFFNNIRMDEARNMLVNKNMSVTEVSQELGFKGLSKFSDAFKKHYGMSPKVMIAASKKVD
ncbi:AraC family transcriptional regulator [Flammeovirga pectinis]|uniref:AraC family transcriptional regulator n=1 Tax=Flammeovirga pectinis TaxID=2494373 RepID=A0A3Q9FJM2_9BACT|nr:AraC family transcriptional regulator [Flammeovirga pectinis]AZQ61244.1 AraC family transcriptional regulator [Flammeovirga pectinis]